MKIQTWLIPLLACGLLMGCAKQTRSISQSGYNQGYVGPVSRELDEFDVLGLDPDKPVTEEEIQRVSTQIKPVQLAGGSSILLVQSGAMFPDGSMVNGLSQHFRVVPFTGLTSEPKPVNVSVNAKETQTRNVIIVSDPDKPAAVVPMSASSKENLQATPTIPEVGAYSRTLRLAAARAGASTVVCYWGILESETEGMATKTVSWLPLMNWVVPDERQHLRMRLKIAVVDVASGSWSVFSTQPQDTKSWSRRAKREAADQNQVEAMKQKSYEMAVKELTTRYAQMVAK